jgi:hypothetical protein
LEVLPGRVIQEENSSITIPLLSVMGVILVPGQLLPMQLQHPSFVQMMSKIVGTDRTFGLTSNTSTSGIGTTAEITSFSIENDDDGDEGLPFVRIKAEGRNVFVVKETWRGADGILMGKVNILPEANISHPYKVNCLNLRTGFKHNERLLPAMTPLPAFVYQQYDPQLLMQRIMSHLESWASFERKSSCPTRATSTRAAAAAAPTPRNHPDLSPVTSPSPSSSTGAPPAPARRVVTKTVRMQDDLMEEVDSHSEDQDEEYGSGSGSGASHQPHHQHQHPHSHDHFHDHDEDDDHEDGHQDQDDDDLEFEQIPSPEELRHELMADSKMDRCSVAPDGPSEFSYWVAANLPLEDKQRIEFLSLTCSIQRLRWLLSLLQRYLFICCSACHQKICRKDDVFSMSVQGAQGTYVNSHGYLHETITVYRAESLLLQDHPSTEYSWFPGYAWSICTCANCYQHIGWKFTTTTDKSLKPEFFWGLSRKQIELGFKGEDPSVKQTFRPVI